MKYRGQDLEGRLILDFEGEVCNISRAVPADSPAVICNGVFLSEKESVFIKDDTILTRFELLDI
jgi:hypothetical protein